MSYTGVSPIIPKPYVDPGASQPLEAWSTASGTTPALAFTATPKIIEWTLTGNSTVTSSGYAQGRKITLLITADGSTRTLAFPAWTWLEGAPTELAAGKVMEVSLLCRSTTEGSVVAVYSVEA